MARYSSVTTAVDMPELRRFRMRIEERVFPCIGAKAALAQGRLQVFPGGDLRDPRSDCMVVEQLQAFAATTSDDDVFISAVVLYEATPLLDELEFERVLWARLRAFHVIDATHHHWDPRVSADPRSTQFSYSVGGRAFYVVGLHPQASRPMRRFPCAALVFNLHSQFETLRADGRYERLRETIAARDAACSGSVNPMLARHGVASEARQYSGREVAADWQCPFSSTAAG
ncbi:MAG: guanitoxin biosynthesis heme-dependent pre-guanitoxin N-hydroxylase GntA, partial [Dokdonella sp.]|uniref:guanitoxin biosynthesis heme-dependent pre-guanitoxin N-hydroxylase GntA n=1 Tax=Dokdonella sp. TaxID=2291710 RepID=UPI003265B2FE